jgi:hypothetical protein
MRVRTIEVAAAAAAVMLAACSQGQGTPSAAPEAPVYATTTGELVCDEYVALAKACIDKGRMPGLVQRRAELTVVERALRDSIKGEPVSLEKGDVWRSALRASSARKRFEASRAKEDGNAMAEVVVDRVPPVELCKSGIDQLPTECQ